LSKDTTNKDTRNFANFCSIALGNTGGMEELTEEEIKQSDIALREGAEAWGNCHINISTLVKKNPEFQNFIHASQSLFRETN